MIADAFVITFLIQMVILMINVIGFTKLPALHIFTIIMTLAVSVQTILAFDEYYLFGVMLVVMNISIPIYGLDKTRKGK